MNRLVGCLVLLLSLTNTHAAEFADLVPVSGTLDFSDPTRAHATWSGANAGAIATPAIGWYDTITLSDSPVLGSGLRLISLWSFAGPLAPGEPYHRTFDFPVFSWLPDGNYYVQSYVDARDDIVEGDETNNSAVSGPFLFERPAGVEQRTFDMNTLRIEELGLGNFDAIPQDSADLDGLDVSHHTLAGSPAAGPPPLLGGIQKWGVGYSDLAAVGYPLGSSAPMLFSFAPEPGRIVKLDGFDLGAFSGGQTAQVTVWDAGFTAVLFDTGLFDVSAGSSSRVDLNLLSEETLNVVIGFGDDIGINNVSYGVSSVIPIPATVFMLLPALGVLLRFSSSRRHQE